MASVKLGLIFRSRRTTACLVCRLSLLVHRLALFLQFRARWTFGLETRVHLLECCVPRLDMVEPFNRY